MAYLRKSPTLIIFFLLVLVISVFATVAVFYQKALTSLNDKIREKDDKIDFLSRTINDINTNLSNLKEDYELQLLREENLTGLYSNLKNEKEKLEDEKKSLLQKINETNTELLKTKIELNNINMQLDTLNQKYLELNDTYNKAVKDLKDICKSASSLNISKCAKYT